MQKSHESSNSKWKNFFELPVFHVNSWKQMDSEKSRHEMVGALITETFISGNCRSNIPDIEYLWKFTR